MEYTKVNITEKDRKLVKKYPRIFANVDVENETNTVFYQSEGWTGIIDNMCEYIQYYLNTHNFENEVVPQVVITNIRNFGPWFKVSYIGGG